MDLFQLLFVLVVLGVLLWLINAYLPLDPNVKKIINIVAIIAIVFWLFRIFFGPMPNANIRVGQ